MRNSYRTKKHTTRTTITKSQIERLRKTRLKNAKTYAQKKYYSSKSFDKTIRKNIKANRSMKNIKNIQKISSSISESSNSQKIVQRLFGEKTTYNSSGKRVKRNSFTSVGQTKRLEKIIGKIEKGTFNIKDYIKNNDRYQKTRAYLPKNPTTEDYLIALDRSDFYYENRKEINIHNKNQMKHGKAIADQMKTGQSLGEKYHLTKEDLDIMSELL